MTTDSTWRALGIETANHLRRLIQFDTSNPPGNELPLARYLDDTLSAAGIETHRFEPLPNRGSLVARLRGNGSAAPVLITAHMDVVGVDRDAWTHDPFGGDTDDGYLYGRGAIDDKGMLAVLLVAMLRIRREMVAEGRVLRRDIIFAATPDE
ncbi:MAG: M20/M25/M40 family metallo-hydrolase, partial [Polaromonas sp.]|nr:M20/M25/M40 family metallo-hydrolase [Gemmatimonadaceae bacterium]